MAFLTSSPKSPVPVIALSLSQTARIRISWDILSVSAALGRLRMSVNKENFVRFDAPNGNGSSGSLGHQQGAGRETRK